MDSVMFWELVGYLASGIVIISLMMGDAKKLRWWNLVGAILFVIYAIAIDAIPVALVNFIVLIIDIYFLVKIYRAERLGSAQVES